MKPLQIAVLAAAFLLPAALLQAESGHKHGDHSMKNAPKAVTISGEVLDLACYMGHEAKGKKHRKCAESCIRDNGAPIGLLTTEGDVYLLVEDHSGKSSYQALKDKAAQTVNVQGTLQTRGGVQAIVVKTVD